MVASSSGIGPERARRILADHGLDVRVGRPLLQTAITPTSRPVDAVIFGDADERYDLVARAERMQRLFPEAAMLAVVRDPGRFNARVLMAAGIDAILSADELERTLGPALEAIESGLIVVPRRLWRDSAPAALPIRQREALGMAAAGLTNAEIAARIAISEGTVSTHLGSAFRRLGIHSRREAAAALFGYAEEN